MAEREHVTPQGTRADLLRILQVEDGEGVSFDGAVERYSANMMRIAFVTEEEQQEKYATRSSFARKVLAAYGITQPLRLGDRGRAMPDAEDQHVLLPEAAWNRLIAQADLIALGFARSIPQEFQQAAGLI